MSVKLKSVGNAVYHNVHYLLNGLDRPNQHPIEAIVNLRDELDRRYIIPSGGIPASDLAEQYISINDLHTAETKLQTLYAKCQIQLNQHEIDIKLNQDDITTNRDDITNLNVLLSQVNNKIDNIPGIDFSIFNGSACIKQVQFTATDSDKVIDITIDDTNKKVIEPTIIKSNGDLAVATVDYTVSYPDDTTLRINFLSNDDYMINYVSGELSDSEFDVLLEYLKKLEQSMYANLSGTMVKPMHNVDIIYSNGKVIREEYTGNINKTIHYEYDSNDNISKKTVVQDNIIKTANYIYDTNGMLIRIEDDGTDIPIDGTRGAKYTLNIEYDSKGFILKETFSGDKNKIIDYERNSFGDVIKKTVTENGEVKVAKYIYDLDRKLIGVEDTGTESVAVVFPNIDCGCQGGSGGSSSDTDITNAEIDLIFSTIFID